MKRLLAITFILLALVLPARAASIKFMNVPMDYDIETFCNQLVSAKKFKIIEQTPRKYTLEGTYMSIHNCTIHVAAHSDGGKVAAVVVSLPKKKTWQAIKGQYDDVCCCFQIDPQYSFVQNAAKFASPYYDGCSNELEAISLGLCDYYTIFSKGQDMLLVGIDTDYSVNIFYVDSNTVGALLSALNDTSSSSSSSGASAQSSSHSSSQSSGEVITFLGLPMSGNYKDFAQRLIDERGFVLHNENPEVPSISLRGIIDGMDNSEVYVFGNSSSYNIESLDVYLPERYTWDEILQEYRSYVDNFKDYYTLVEQNTGFKSDVAQGREVQAVRDDECKYYALFRTTGGSILVTISSYMQVRITFICN